MTDLIQTLHYITVATKPHPVLEDIKLHVNKNKEQLTILGLQENRNIGWEGNANFGIKLREVQNYLNDKRIRPQDIILLTDAYDIIYCGSLKEIMKRYLDMDKPIIFGCETKCHPDKDKSSLYSKLDVEFPYLNSGMYIGQAWALRYCLSDYKYNDADDDQRFWTHKFLNYPSLIGLDYENTLFLNTEGVNLEEIILKKDVASYKNSNPQFIHINGPDKTKINNFRNR